MVKSLISEIAQSNCSKLITLASESAYLHLGALDPSFTQKKNEVTIKVI